MRVVAACVAFVCMLATTAAAQPGRTQPAGPTVPAPYQYQPPSPNGPVVMYTQHYGTKVALVDGLSFGAILIGAMVFAISIANDVDSSDNNDDGNLAAGAVLMVGGTIGLIAGGPLVHVSKHNHSSAWKSLGLRIGLPLLGSLVGGLIDGDCDSSVESDCGNMAGSLGGLGLIGAMVIDWTMLSKRQVAY